MSKPSIELRAEQADDLPAILNLHDKAFGPGRFARTAYVMRAGTRPDERLSLVAEIDGQLIGSLRFTALEIGGKRGALLLGPLVVNPEFSGAGHGLRLIEAGMTLAQQQGYQLVLLIGDLPYYGRIGFARAPMGLFTFPGPIEAHRLLYKNLIEREGLNFSGDVKAVNPANTDRV